MRLEHHPKTYRAMIRWIDVRDGYGGLPEVAMVISESALNRIGFTAADEEFLARDIARQMVAYREEHRRG